MGISSSVFHQYWINILVVVFLLKFALICHFLRILSPGLPLMFLIVASLVLAPVLASTMGEWLASMFYPSNVEAGPAYSLPEAHRKRGSFDQAYQAYATVAREFPGEFQAHAAMLEIATENLRDPDLAKHTLERGLEDDLDEPDQQRLRRLYDALMVELGKTKKQAEPLPLDPLDPN